MSFKFQHILLGFSVLLVSLCAGAVVDVPKGVEFFDLEMPLRCSVKNFQEQELASTVVIQPQDFTVRLVSQTNPLPRYQVNSFSSCKQPLEVVLQNLLTEAGIQVAVSEGVYPVLSVKALKGELSKVIEEIAKQAGIFYSYNSERKILTIKPKAQMLIQLPRDQKVMMAVIDAMKGAQIEPLTADWENYQVTMTSTREDLNKARHLMSSFLRDRYLLSAEMSLYQLCPFNSVSHWEQLIMAFGKSRFAISEAGLGGTLLVLKPALNVLQLVAKAMDNYKVIPLAQGQMVVPSGWKVHFNLGECALDRLYQDFSVSLRSEIQNKKNAKNTLTLDTKKGELAKFDFINGLDQEAAVVGIPVPDQQNSEMLLTVKFNMISLVKKGE